MKFLDYIKGIRKGKDAHRIEYDAMSDPFLSDAIEGYDSVRGDHADSIARMQARIAAKTNSRKGRSGAWKVAVAAVAVISAVSGYFSLMNHQSSMATAGCDNCFIDIYAPEDYIERKRLELTLMQEQNPTKEVAATAIVNIENLKEVIKPVERINVYLPDSYAQMKNSDLEELAFYEKRRTSRKESPVDLESPENNTREIEKEIKSEPKKKRPKSIYANSQSSFRIVGDISDDMLDSVQEDSPLLATEQANRNSFDERVSTNTPAPSARDKVEKNKSNRQAQNTKEIVASSSAKKTTTISGAVREMDEAKLYGLYAGAGAVIVDQERAASYPLIGYDKYKDYLRTNLIRPVSSECADKKGTVIVEFTVGKDGKPRDVKVIKSLCQDSDKEAVRLIKAGSDWTFSSEKVKVEVLF